MYGVEGGGVVFFKGASGQVYRFSVHPWQAPLRRLPGVYLATVREVAEGMETHSVIFVGETDDISSPFHRHPKGACLHMHRRKCKCVCLHSDTAWRTGVRDDLIAAHDPPYNAVG